MVLQYSNKSIDKDPEDVRQATIDKINKILKTVFSDNIAKQQANDMGARYNFACPYCKDSAKNDHAKRGNLYFKNYGYKCYNCGIYKDTETFMKDFGEKLDSGELIHVRNIHSKEISKHTNSSSFIDLKYIYDNKALKKFAIDKDTIFKKYKLVNIKQDPWIENYLINRFQTNFDVFGWDKKFKRLYIFNLIDNDKIIGFQVRNFNPKATVKYVTYTIDMIYKDMDINLSKKLSEIELAEIIKLSYTFGLDKINISQMITVTEGPLDSFLIKNAASTCGLNNDFPFELKNIQWMDDFDKDGIKKSLERIKMGDRVFLWKKYLKDMKINIYNKKLDYTDVIKIAKEKDIPLLPIQNYFSNNKYDAYYIS